MRSLAGTIRTPPKAVKDKREDGQRLD